MQEEPTKPKQRRGFACMSVKKRAAIARLGGLSVPKECRSFSQDRTLAREAGAKGGRNGVGIAKQRAGAIGGKATGPSKARTRGCGTRGK